MKETVSFSVALVTQGRHKFYSGTMPIDLIATTCSVNPREDDPESGFQRQLSEKRADDIANYIRNGGTIPSSIILSAQEGANLKYSSSKRSVSITPTSGAFLILDGQHRVYGFRKLLSDGVKYRIPVIIFNELSSIDEARIFIDINTLQKPVPTELLLDIKRLADRETAGEALLDELFTLFETKPNSYLKGKLSRIDKKKGKISKVTFYSSMGVIVRSFEITSVDRLFQIMNAYFHAASDIFDSSGYSLDESVVKSTTFKVLVQHSKSVISVISEHSPDSLAKTSVHKKYLERSLSGSIKEILSSRAYTKTAGSLDKKLVNKNVRI